ncbi:DUF481 domain-containing protein [Salinisphaera orenii]|uniref:DUF481 domain-containing protein n=1 Tax=Salinisphaera orenii TaxID=856731 RepID=UPI0013A5FA2A
MSDRMRIALSGLAILGVTTGSAVADTVYLKGGSQLEGQVQTMTANKLTLDTDYADTLTLDRDTLAGVTTDEAVPVALGPNQTSTVRLAYDSDAESQYAYTEDAQQETGRKRIELTSVDQLRPQKIAENKRQTEAKKYQLPEYAHETGPDNVVWSGNGRLGINGSRGNSENTNILASISALRSTGLTRLDLLASANMSTSDGDKTEEDYLGKASYERDLSRRLFMFASQSLEHDRFQNYDLRSRTLAGPGYFVVRQPRLIFKLHGGLGYEFTKYYESGQSENEMVAAAGWHYGELFGDYLKLTHDFDIYPQLTDSPTNNFSLKSVLAATVPIADSSVWAVSAQLENDYNNNPKDSDTDKLDTIYSLTLQRSF